jgi:hypothetical protein
VAAIAAVLAAAGCKGEPQAEWPEWKPGRTTAIPASGVAQPATDLCLMPVLDGAPTEADIGQVHRMISQVEMLPGVPRPWISAHNRGGEWTIDGDGRYAPFDGPSPSPGLSLEYEVEDSGRIVGLDHGGALLVLDPGAERFRQIKDMGGGFRIVSRVPRTDVILLNVKGAPLRLVGEEIEGWSEWTAAQRAGLSGVHGIYDLEEFGASLFSDGDRGIAIRFDDGRWAALPRLERRRGQARYHGEQVQRATAALASRAVLVETSERFLLIRFPEGAGQPLTTEVLGPNRSRRSDHDRFYVIPATGELLRYRQRHPGEAASWSRLSANGFEAIEGGAAIVRSGTSLFDRLHHIPERGWMVFAGQDGVVVYDGRRMTLAKGPSLGRVPSIIDIPGSDLVLVSSDQGLLSLGRDLRLSPVAAPFETGGVNGPRFEPAAGTQGVMVYAREGVFLARPDGRFTRVPGSEALGGGRLVGEIPVSRDLLVSGRNALHLIVNDRSPRWRTCVANRTTAAEPVS